MTPITDDQLSKLAPYLDGSRPDSRGEMAMYCPLHLDTRKSASINLDMGAWYCYAGCGGGSIRQLIDAADSWVAAAGRQKDLSVAALKATAASVIDTALSRSGDLEEDVDRWNARLLRDHVASRLLYELRGLTRKTIIKARIGYDGRRFKIPVYSPDRILWNVRTYDPNPLRGRRKIWSVRGMGRARLFPAGIFDRLEDRDCIIFCEGEWDTLLALQQGYAAVTRTDGAGKPWHPEWDCAFAGLSVFLCHDADVQGQKGNDIVGRNLSKIASVYQCELPYAITPKNGRDLTDFLMDEEEPGVALGTLMSNAKRFRSNK